MRAVRVWQPRARGAQGSSAAARQGRHRVRTFAGPSSSSSSAMQPTASDSASRQQQQHWCRPLSGCTEPPLSPPLAGAGADQAAAAQHLQQQQHLPPIVALGKFDALHRGHRALAAAASALGGTPWMVSFSGMADVLGWPERLPLVAPCDRQRVLSTWAAHCQGREPRECAIPFAEVRTMSPEAFVELLAAELQAVGVVVGSNYRFGYRAAGTAGLLQQLGEQHGMRVQVLNLVGSQQDAGAAAGAAAEPAAAQQVQQQQQQQQQQSDQDLQLPPPPQQQQHDQQQQRQQQHDLAQPSREQRAADREQAHTAVSSSRVRHALAAGHMHVAAECLGRPYRLVASLRDAAASALPDGPALRVRAAALLNQPPCPGRYQVQAVVVGSNTREQLLPPRQALLGVDEAGITLHGGGKLLGHLPAGAQHLAIDFL